jgi:hypothetical protein
VVDGHGNGLTTDFTEAIGYDNRNGHCLTADFTEDSGYCNRKILEELHDGAR